MSASVVAEPSAKQDSYRGDKKTSEHTQLVGIVSGPVGLKSVYVLLPCGQKRKHINETPRKSQESAGTVPAQSCENHIFKSKQSRKGVFFTVGCSKVCEV